MNDPDEPSTWTDEFALAHLKATFDQACRTHPDIMEPYMIRLDGEGDKETMRAGLRETINQRYPVIPVKAAA